MNPMIIKAKRKGQGVVEYAGAMIVAALIVASLTAGMAQGNWMYNAYESIFNSAGNMTLNALNDLNPSS